MLVLTISCILSLFLYTLLIGWYWQSWKKNPGYICNNAVSHSGFSVIIPFRDEQEQLPCILNALLLQDYPTEKTEVILVNDHSKDKSVSVVQNFCMQHDHFKIIHLKPKEQGKKMAIQAGIQSSRYGYIVTTDADCRPGVKWLSCLASYCNDYSPCMVIGLVSAETSGNKWLEYFQQIEMISLVGSGAASAMGGKPVFCSGANLCYPKEIFHHYNDPFKFAVASGEDTLFLLKVKREFRDRIYVLKSKEAIVYTKTERTFSGFIKQRARWISKSIHYRDSEIVYSSLVVFLANAGIVLCVVFLFMGIQPGLFAGLFACKLFIDGIFMYTLFKFFGLKFRPFFYVVSEIIYPFYLVVTAFLGFMLPGEWKGRKSVPHF